MRKKLFVILGVLVALSMILAACGTPTPQIVEKIVTQEVEKVVTQEVEKIVTQEVVKEVAAEKVQIRWFVGLGTGTDPGQLPGQQKAVDDFNATHSDIELVLEVVPYDSAYATLATQIASGNGPDIIGPVGWGGSAAFYGQWLDMAPYIEETRFNTSVYDPALIKFYQTEEGQVGLPFLVFPAAIFYVPAMFDEAGLEYPPAKYGDKYKLDGKEVDWNWDTFTEVARRLTIDVNGKNSTETGFDKAQVAQVGYSPQWQTHVLYMAAYRAGMADIVDGDAKGSYKVNFPDSFKEANKWYYDGMYGEKPFAATGPLASAPEFGNGNLMNTGKSAMALTPLWYTCCMGDFATAGMEFQIGVMPVGDDGAVHGRVDADTFRIWKGSKHPKEAFVAVSYLIGPEGTRTLVVGGGDVAAPYSGLPAIPEFQQPYIDSLLAKYPFTTQATWDTFLAGLAYPDAPSAEQWQPNWNEAWAREQTFFDLMQNTGPDQLDFDAEWQKMIDDLNLIFNK